MWRRKRLLTGVLLLALVGWGPVGATGATAFAPSEHGQSQASVAEVSGSEMSGGEKEVSSAQAQEPTCDYETLYDQTIGSVVTIQVRAAGGGGLGSGFVYNGSYVVTNQHVVANATEVEVQFDRGQWRTARVVGTDTYSDLAVLRVRNVPDYAESLDVNASAAEPGQPVAALGSPLGLQGTITGGLVSAVNRSLPAGGPQGPQFTIPNTIQTTAAINPGNSGGPLVNCRGEVVGVNTAGARGGENIGFAVPASRVERVVPSLVENGSYDHSFLGITSADVSPTVAEANDLNVTRGVLVVGVVPGSPADGVLRGSDETEVVEGVEIPTGGDVILRVGGQRIASQEDLASVLVQQRPGDTVRMTVLRDGERQQVQVELGTRPAPGT